MLRNFLVPVAISLAACTSTQGLEPLDWSPLAGLPQPAPERSVQLLHADLQLDLDLLDGRLEGVSTSWIRALGRPVSQVTMRGGHGVREVLDARGRSLVFEAENGAVRVDLVEPLQPGEELPLTARFSALRPPGVSFGETAPGPSWNPWVSAGPRLDSASAGPLPWFPLVEPEQACATFAATVRAGHGVRVFLGGLPSEPPSAPEADSAGTRTFTFRSQERRTLGRLALAAGRLRQAGAGSMEERVFVPHAESSEFGGRLVRATRTREEALGYRPAAGLSSGLEAAPPVVVVLPDGRGQRLDGLGVIGLGPALAQRLADGGWAGTPDPLALALARDQVAGRHTAARSSEAWFLEALAGFQSMRTVAAQGGLRVELFAMSEALSAGSVARRMRSVLGLEGPGDALRKGALALAAIGREFGFEPLDQAIDRALAARRGDSLAPGDLVRAFRTLDGRDIGARLDELIRRSGRPDWPEEAQAAALVGAGLRAAARQQADGLLRLLASRRLGERVDEDPAALTLLFDQARNDPLPRLQVEALRRLPANQPAAREFLQQAASGHPEAAGRGAALAALWEAAQEDDNLAKELRSAAEQERDLALRAAYGDLMLALRSSR